MKKNKIILTLFFILSISNLVMAQNTSKCIGNLGTPNPWPYPSAFDGGYIPIGNFGAQNQFSISFWINPAPVQNGIAIILDAAHGGSNNWVIQTLNSGTNWTWGNMTFNLTPNIWQNVLLTYDNGIKKLYVDGFLNQSINQTITYAGSPSLNLGNWPEGGRRFNGLIDELYISTDIIVNSNFTPVQFNYPSNNTWGIWHFDEGIGNTTSSVNSTSYSLNNWYWSDRLINNQSCTSNTITADGPTTFCAGNSVNLKSDVVGGTYQWKKNGVNITTNATSRTYKATATGSYTCVATCNGTALTSNAIQVTSQTNAAVTLSASGATSFCAGDSITLNATNLGSGYSVQWYRTNISMQGSTNYSVVVKQPGTYKTVTKNLSNGCSRISSGSIITAVNCRMSNPDIIAVDPVNDEIPATKLGNSTETAMHLFPNPNAGSFTLEYDGIEADFEVQVLNTMGQVIYNDIIPSNDKHLKTTINLGDNMQKGVYVVRIINGEEVHESKVMLQ